MTFLPDTNACITLLRQKNPAVIARWHGTKPSEIVLCSILEDWET
jgi:predicted nucleic acid-binding protein